MFRLCRRWADTREMNLGEAKKKASREDELKKENKDMKKQVKKLKALKTGDQDHDKTLEVRPVNLLINDQVNEAYFLLRT